MPLPRPTADETRLQTLHSLAEIDTTLDTTLNDWVKVVATALQCPYAAVCLMDADQHWLKASFGLATSAALGDTGLHWRVALERDVVTVADVRADPSLAGSPIADQFPDVRFYAAAPLRVDGHVVGVLCTAGPAPKSLQESERVLLLDFAHAIEHWFVSQRENRRLAARERQFRELAEQMPGIVYRAALDPDSSTLFVSSRIRELGYTPEEWISQPNAWLDALHPLDRDKTLMELKRGLERGGQFELTYRLRDKGGAWRHFRDTVQLVQSEKEEDSIIQGVMIDVTEQAVALAERELLLHDLPDAVLLLNPEKRITDANPQAAQILGKSVDDLKGRHIGHLFFGADVPALADREARLMETMPDMIEWEYWHPDKGLRTIEDYRRVVDGGAEIRVLRDVTHRRSESGWLRMLAQAADQASEAIVITDLAANIVYVNRAMTTTSGYSHSELMGRNSRMLQSGLTPTTRYKKMWACLTSGKTWRGFLNNQRKDGSHYIEYAVITPIRDQAGKITNYLAVKEDITEKRRMSEDLDRYRLHLDELVQQRTEELDRAKQMAEKANAAKSAFLASMSHEIRTPMNGVLGIAEVLEHSGLNPHQIELVNTIQESANVLLSLIEDILDFSKIEAGRLELALAPFDLLHLVEHASDNLLPLAVKRGVELQTYVDPALKNCWIGDAKRVRQIVLNLLGNAIKFSAGLDRTGIARLRVVPSTAGGLSLVVHDNGIGMSDDVQKRIFQPFEQGDVSTHGTYGGTGLGLAICKRLVAAMGGHIAVTSSPDNGAVFTVDLPLAKAGSQERDQAYDLTGVKCHIEPDASIPAEDWKRYLEASGADVAVASPALSAPIPPGAVLLCRERRLRAGPTHKPQVRLVEGPRDLSAHSEEQVVTLGINGLHRSDLLTAVAMACGRVAAPALAPVPPSTPVCQWPATVSSQWVLVAEDNEINQQVIRRQLDLLGLQAEVYGDGMTAWNSWCQAPHRYALLLTDLRMPGLDGISLARKIRTSSDAGHLLPIVALTANASKSEAARCHEAGMNGYLTKPITLDNLQSCLHSLLCSASSSLPPRVESQRSSEVDTTSAWNAFDDDLPVRLLGEDPVQLRELRTRLALSARRAIQDIRQAASNADWSAVGLTAHRVKSSARATGATGLSLLMDRIESAARERRIEDLQRYVKELPGAFEAMCRHFDVSPDQESAMALELIVVDDDKQQHEVVSAFARGCGIGRTLCFEDGFDALNFLVPHHRPGQLLMIDLMMPGIDGVELIRHLAAERFRGGVVLYTAADPRLREVAQRILQDSGIRSLGHLSKPFLKDRFAALWDEWISLNS